jgi:hypothetical protein
MGSFMKETSEMGRETPPVFIITQMGTFTTGNGKITKGMVKVE